MIHTLYFATYISNPDPTTTAYPIPQSHRIDTYTHPNGHTIRVDTTDHRTPDATPCTFADYLAAHHPTHANPSLGSLPFQIPPQNLTQISAYTETRDTTLTI